MHHEDIYPRLRPPPMGSSQLLEDFDEEELDLESEEELREARSRTAFLGGLSPEELTPVAEIMTRNVFCAKPDMSLENLAYVMLDQSISGAPVVDDAGKPIGVISKTDVLRELRERAELEKATWRERDSSSKQQRARSTGLHMHTLSERNVQDAMTPLVYWLPEDASISQASALMAYERVHRIPIVNKTGKVVGVVSTLDILRWIARRKGYLIPR